MRWSIEIPHSPTTIADHIRAAPRWNGRRDGFNNGRFLVAESFPVQCDQGGFRFLVPLNERWPILLSGRFYVVGEMTRIDVSATVPRHTWIILWLTTVPLSAVPLIGLWPVNRWLAIGLTLAPIVFVASFFALGFWLNKKMVRKHVDSFLLTLEKPAP